MTSRTKRLVTDDIERRGRVDAGSGAGVWLVLGFGMLSCDPNGIFVVTEPLDGAENSLRSVITRANASTATSIRIEIAPGTYELRSCGADDTNQGGDLDITTDKPVTLVAQAPHVIIRQVCPGERVLDDHGAGLLTLSNVTLMGGSVMSTDPAESARGGGVRSRGDVKLELTTIRDNSVRGALGQSAANGGGTPVAGGEARGGGLYVDGSLHSVGSTFAENAALGGAGADAEDSSDVASSGGSAEGGGAYVTGAVNIDGGNLLSNRSIGGRGGISGSVPGAGGSARGGGLAQSASSGSAVSVRGSLSNNLAQGGDVAGGGVTFGTPTGPSAGEARGGAVSAGTGDVSIDGLVATGNQVTGGSAASCVTCPPGGGRGGVVAASSVRVREGTFTQNRAASGPAGWVCFGSFGCNGAPPSHALGGAIWAASSLDITDGAFSNNSAQQGNALRFLPFDGGGAVAADVALTVRGGLFRGNRVGPEAPINVFVGHGAAAYSAGDGNVTAGLFLDNPGASAVYAKRQLTLTDTHSAFNGEGAGAGGALTALRVQIGENGRNGVTAGGSVALSDSSVAGNGRAGVACTGDVSLANTTVAGNGTRGIESNAAISLRNTTLSGNHGALSGIHVHLDHVTIVDDSSEPAIFASRLSTYRSVVITSSGACGVGHATDSTSAYNWFADASCLLPVRNNQQSSAAFLLGPLSDNGGPAPTHLPGTGSVLIDGIPAGACPILTDARGVVRPGGAACDIGAVEVEQ